MAGWVLVVSIAGDGSVGGGVGSVVLGGVALSLGDVWGAVSVGDWVGWLGGSVRGWSGDAVVVDGDGWMGVASWAGCGRGAGVGGSAGCCTGVAGSDGLVGGCVGLAGADGVAGVGMGLAGSEETWVGMSAGIGMSTGVGGAGWTVTSTVDVLLLLHDVLHVAWAVAG